MDRFQLEKLVTKISGVLVFSSLLSVGIATSADAVIVGISDFTGGTELDNSLTYGYRFRATEDLTISSLGVYDIGGDGLNATTVDVGLWDDSGILLGEVDVLGGTAAPIEDGFRYQPLATSIDLTSGNFYRVAADMSDILGTDVVANAIATTLNGIDSVQVAGGNAGFNFPVTTFGPGTASLGGNILFAEATPVPFELSPNLAILMLGGIWGISRLRKRLTAHKAIDKELG